MSTRLTLVSNASQNLRCPLLLSPSSDPRSAVLATAKSKLRLKKPTRIFLPGGQELLTSADILSHLTNDLTLLISTGESYIGNTTPPPLPTTIHTITSTLPLDPLAITQLQTCSRLPGMISTIGLPDLHPGNKYPIGCVFLSTQIHPPLIGGDIGCGMSWYRTTLKPTHLSTPSHLKRIASTLHLEGPWSTPEARASWLSPISTPYDTHIGTIGSGNHFAELQLVEEITPYTSPTSTYTPPLTPGEVILLVHSGSRGFGQHILSQHPNSPTTPEEVSSYLNLHDTACTWARRNRDLIALRFLQCIESAPPISSLEVLDRKILDITHNNVALTPWPPSAPTGDVYIHRKGAAPIAPFLPLPGSRGTPTLVLHPVGDGVRNGLSLAHGAGRAMSRARAKGIEGRYGGDVEVVTGMKGGKMPGWVVCDDKELVWEEAVEAYKDVEVVAGEMVECGVAVVVGRCGPRVTYKVRKE